MDEMNNQNLHHDHNHDHHQHDFCNCGHGMWGHHGRYSMLRVLLGLLVLMLVFCMGFKLGKIVGIIHGNGYGKMDHMGNVMYKTQAPMFEYKMMSPGTMVVPPSSTTTPKK